MALVNNNPIRRFVPDSYLKAYLKLKKPTSALVCRNSDLSSLGEVLELLKQIISEERLYDARNASIVLCDASLEQALNIKALHLSEIR